LNANTMKEEKNKACAQFEGPCMKKNSKRKVTWTRKRTRTTTTNAKRRLEARQDRELQMRKEKENAMESRTRSHAAEQIFRD